MNRLIYILLLILPFCVNAQTEAMYSQYLFNKLVLNPAYAGSREGVCAVLIYRNQWTGIEGSPKTMLATFHSVSPNRKYGFGGNLFNDKLGIINSYTFNGNFAYRFFIGKSVLALGLNGGLSYTSANINDLTAYQQGDIAGFDAMGKAQIIPNAGAGIYFKNKRLAIGLSVPQIFNNRLLKNVETPLSNHYYFTFDYLINVGKQYNLQGQKVSLVPSLLIKFVPATNFHVDFNMSLVLYSQFWIGFGYRSDNSLIFSAQYSLNKFVKNSSTSFRLGYSYDLANKAYRAQSAGTHEILFMFDLARNKNKILSPRLF
jgi:type IX secretion system PorP/SprF family membrane protein